MKRLVPLLALLVLFAAGAAKASTLVPFGDTAIFWPGFSDHKDHNHQNATDVIGAPQLTGGAFLFDGHSLTGIDLNYASTSSVLVPADWFFDFNQDGNWDYVLHNANKAVGGANAYALYDLRAQHLAISRNGIYAFSSWPSGTVGRYDHPVALKNAFLKTVADDSIDFTGWVTRNSLAPATASWRGFSLDLEGYEGRNFTYGFAMLCANDVLYGQAPVPNPEPGTLLLMGIGALGGAMLRKRRQQA